MNWLEVASHPLCVPDQKFHDHYVMVVRLLERVPVQTFVSLGPGDARLDEALSSHLTLRDPWLRYIPVDMNEYLLAHAIEAVRQHAQIPVAIQTDFEARLPYIRPLLSAHGRGPNLFAILGYTFGNLDGLEQGFLDCLKALMQAGDHLLMDFLVVPSGWRASAYQKDAYREYPHGVALRNGEAVDGVIKDFEQRMVFKKGYSNVPDAYGTKIIDSFRDDQLVSHVRRYRTDKFAKWLERLGFDVVGRCELDAHDTYGGTGIVLVRV